jgi:DUF4097 and DUF4098 domain-containing protein YvlB
MLSVLGVTPVGLSAQSDFEWRGRVDRGDAIEIKGITGDIRAERTSGSEIEVVATKHGRSRDFDEVTFDVVEHEDGVTICAIYPVRRRSRSMECDEGGGHDVNLRDIDVEVDFEVRVPSGVVFIGRTISGDVEAFGLDAEVIATTVSGDVEVTTEDIVHATTVSGTIRVAMGRTDWRGELEFTTVSGDIILEVPDGLNTDVEFSAVSGEMDSDFPISMQGTRFRPTSLRGTIGDGGRSLALKTVSGDVILKRRRG